MRIWLVTITALLLSCGRIGYDDRTTNPSQDGDAGLADDLSSIDGGSIDAPLDSNAPLLQCVGETSCVECALNCGVGVPQDGCPDGVRCDLICIGPECDPATECFVCMAP